MARTTIRDIARTTGLSITAVSLVLNQKPHRISEENCELIRTTAKKMHYRPNRLAVGLIKKTTHTIGLIIPDISNSFFSELTKSIEETLIKENFNLLLCNSNDKSTYERECINMLADNSVDGLLFVMASETHGKEELLTLEELQYSGIPTVIIDRLETNKEFSTVYIDNRKAAKHAVKHLIDLGHKKIACITGALDSHISSERLAGYKDALKEYNLSYEDDLIYSKDFKYQTGYNAIKKLLPEKPTAILCLNDMIAYGAMHALKKENIKIPDEISVVGFDDIFFSKMAEVPLTTIHQPIQEMGHTAVSLLLEQLNQKQDIQHIKLSSRLIKRESTAPAAV